MLFLNTLRFNHLPTMTEKHKVKLFLKSISYCQKKLFSQTKNYFYYFNIAFEMSCTIVFLVFAVLNTKYLIFTIPNTSILILS